MHDSSENVTREFKRRE